MNRRRFIATAATLGAVATAGCLASDGSGGTPTPTETPTMTDTTFTVQQVESGTEVDEATVSFEEGTVTVEGTIWGADGCTTAELASADYDPDSGELTVDVATVREEPTGDVACTQAIVEIDYEATATFENGLPDTVVVTHTRGQDSTEVTTAQP